MNLGLLGSYNDSPVNVCKGQYGFFLNNNNNNYKVPLCYQQPTFNLDNAIKIIEYKNKWRDQQETTSEVDIQK